MRFTTRSASAHGTPRSATVCSPRGTAGAFVTKSCVHAFCGWIRMRSQTLRRRQRQKERNCMRSQTLRRRQRQKELKLLRLRIHTFQYASVEGERARGAMLFTTRSASAHGTPRSATRGTAAIARLVAHMCRDPKIGTCACGNGEKDASVPSRGSAQMLYTNAIVRTLCHYL